jgi:hypothetical protein
MLVELPTTKTNDASSSTQPVSLPSSSSSTSSSSSASPSSSAVSETLASRHPQLLRPYRLTARL